MEELIKCRIPKKFCNARTTGGGCILNTECKPVVDKCRSTWIDPEDHDKGKTPDCSRIEEGYCKAYINPEYKWTLTKECPLADHIVRESKKFERRRVGQQKQRRR